MLCLKCPNRTDGTKALMHVSACEFSGCQVAAFTAGRGGYADGRPDNGCDDPPAHVCPRTLGPHVSREVVHGVLDRARQVGKLEALLGTYAEQERHWLIGAYQQAMIGMALATVGAE